YDEPLLRLAYGLPDDLIPRALEVAADLKGEEEDRRAYAFSGLLHKFVLLERRNPNVARAAWNETLRRLARRPRPEFLRDLVGFHKLARVLVGPRKEAEFTRALSFTVQEVCSWMWAKSSGDSSLHRDRDKTVANNNL